MGVNWRIILFSHALPAPSPHFPSFRHTAAQPAAKRRRDSAEEAGVKDKLILEMRAEITRLRANVMTAHEKIRTLEQIHAHDEERIASLQDELGIQQKSGTLPLGGSVQNDDDAHLAKKPRAEPENTAEV